MLRGTRYLCRYFTIDQVANIVKAKQSCSDAVRNIQLIDVRSTAEVAATGMIPSAINVPLPVLSDALSPESIIEDDEFEFFFGGPRPVQGVTQLVLYCAHGVRSAIACELAEELGFENAGNFSGSWAQWYHAYGTPSTSAAPPESSPTPLQ
ncbi:rhodanese-like protein [Leishmania panamensis]|uniref:Rhodanese-like protein n=3 Tax=Viannia TaxID=37616 RepID=A0A088RJS6_LEIPA|nr:rhodanese-like protein [Leishmania panamensis]AIN96060.1 rhodanese-like protein [Leishmania panamensis]